MKVVFDAYWWVEGPSSLRHVLREIVIAWHDSFPEDELVLVVRHAHLSRAAEGLPSGVTLRTTAMWPQALAAAVSVPATARRITADIVITHNFAAHSAGALSAVYLHDVLFLTNPEWFTRVERAYFSFMRRLAPRADIVFASTSTEGQRIAQHTRARAVIPVGLGLSSELANSSDEEVEPLLEPRSYLLTVGRLNVRKNVAGVIRAALATGLISPQRPLVVVGEPGGRRTELDDAAMAAVTSGAVIFTGLVSEARLRWLYRNTSLFVCLSLGEGFGMPPVEAAYFSATTLVSDLPVFRETLGGAASYVDPRDEHAVARAIARGVREGESRAPSLRPRGSIAKRHDWADTVLMMRESAVGRLETRRFAALEVVGRPRGRSRIEAAG